MMSKNVEYFNFNDHIKSHAKNEIYLNGKGLNFKIRSWKSLISPNSKTIRCFF